MQTLMQTRVQTPLHLRPVLLALLLIGGTSLSARAEIQNYAIDTEHSFANWEIRHVVSRVSGTFHGVKGSIRLDTDDVANSGVEAAIDVYSLNSSHLQRDVHLLTDEYLGANKYPEMKFVSTRISPQTTDRGSLTGNLSLHGTTRPVSMHYRILGLGKDPWGGMRIGFKATAQLNREDFGIKTGLPYGPVGNEMEITLLIEAFRLDADGQPWNAQKAAEGQSRVEIVPVPSEVIPAPVPIPANATSTPAAPTPAASIPSGTPAVPPAPAAQQATTPDTSAADATPSSTSAPEKKESPKELLKRELLKGLFN